MCLTLLGKSNRPRFNRASLRFLVPRKKQCRTPRTPPPNLQPTFSWTPSRSDRNTQYKRVKLHWFRIIPPAPSSTPAGSAGPEYLHRSSLGMLSFYQTIRIIKSTKVTSNLSTMNKKKWILLTSQGEYGNFPPRSIGSLPLRLQTTYGPAVRLQMHPHVCYI